jgi:hypothetical protein
MVGVTQLVRHIREVDALADDSVLALGLLIGSSCEMRPPSDPPPSELVGDLALPTSEGARVYETAEAVRELWRYIVETPLPLPGAVWALSKAHDPRLADALASVLIRALDRQANLLAYQALAALTMLPDDAVPVDMIRLAAAKGDDEVRELAQDWLSFPGR